MLTDAVQIEMIRAVPGFAAAVGAVLAAWFSYRSASHSKETLQVATRTEHNTNGLVEKLNEQTAKASRAQGNVEGRAELTQETREQPGDGQDPRTQDEPHGSLYKRTEP